MWEHKKLIHIYVYIYNYVHNSDLHSVCTSEHAYYVLLINKCNLTGDYPQGGVAGGTLQCRNKIAVVHSIYILLVHSTNRKYGYLCG